ncbi:hypothetical protein BaRGS_00001434 [Batillaria attramentaria]|uniref:Uncharacterized protein n=1 Tax=Batillaria attramentaria TaxID=370345 RepID=A0ABD0M6B3_9CAEN|nr:hypothetical protein BaRGS_000374 [Batillaria attramentaria]
MSFYYYRKPKPEEKVEGWGFKKVNPTELTGILERVTRPTYNSRMHNMENTQVHNYKYTNTNFLAKRSPTSCDRRRSASAALPHAHRRLSDRELQRVVRRLRKPTISYEASRYDFIPYHEADVDPDRVIRPRTAPGEDRQKAFMQLSRPTTASRAKTLGDCVLCADREELEMKNSLVPFEYDYGDEKCVPPEELDDIVERVSAPTFSRQRQRCPRQPRPVNEVQIREKTPLASGLPRSKSVKEIVQRLYSANRHRYNAPVATEITIFT